MLKNAYFIGIFDYFAYLFPKKAFSMVNTVNTCMFSRPAKKMKLLKKITRMRMIL